MDFEQEQQFVAETKKYVTENLPLSRLSDEELQQRPQQPLKRQRVVSKALRAYAQSVTSADKGGVRIID